MKRFRFVAAQLLSWMILGSSTAALADDKAAQTAHQSSDDKDAETLVNEAISLFQSGAYQKAIDLFKEAYDIIEEPNILFNIARCYQELDDNENAVEYFNRVIYHPDAPVDAKSAARQRLRELQASPADDPEGPAPVASQTGSDAAGAPAADGDDPALADAPGISRVPEWVLIGAGAVFAVTGAALGGVALANHKTFEESDDRQEKQDLETKGRALALASDITLGVGIASVATGVILFLARGRGEKEAPRATSFVPAATRDSVELSWVVRF